MRFQMINLSILCIDLNEVSAYRRLVLVIAGNNFQSLYNVAFLPMDFDIVMYTN